MEAREDPKRANGFVEFAISNDGDRDSDHFGAIKDTG